MQSISSASTRSRKSYSFLYRLLGRQLNQPSFTSLTYSVLLLIDLIIFILYPIIQHFTSLTALRLSASSEDLDNKNYVGVMLIIIIPVALAFIILTNILLIVNFYKSNKAQEQDNLASKFIQRFLNRINVLFRTVLYMPLLHVIVSTFSLDISNKVPKQVIISLGTLGIILFVLLLILFCILTESSNPYSQHHWGSASPYATIFKCILKTLFVILIQFGTTKTVKVITAIQCVISLSWILYSLFVHQAFYQYHRMIQRAAVSICFWINLQLLISQSNPSESILVDIIFMMIGTILSVVSVNYLFKLMLQKNQLKLEGGKKEVTILTGIISSINLIEKNQFHRPFSKHLLECKVTDCACKNILKKISNQEEVGETDYYLYLQQIILDKLGILEQKGKLQILLSYIYLVKLKMKNFSITLLNSLKQRYQDYNFINKFKIQCLEAVISNYIYQLSEKNSIQLQIQKCYLTHKKYTEFRFTIFKTCNNIIDFWKILNVKDYNMEAIYKLNRNMIEDSKYITQQFNSLHEINPTNKQIIVEYIEFRQNFLSEDISQYKEMLQDLKKVVDGEGKYLDPMSALFLNTGHPGIVVVSANEYNFNIIHYVNSYFLIKAAYYQRDVIGQSLDMFIPPPFKQKHVEHMKSYINAKQIESTRPNIRIHMYGSNKNIILGTMTVSLLNDVSEGLLFIGLINFEDCNEKLIFVSDKGIIYGMNQQFINDFGKVLQENIKELLPEIDINKLVEGSAESATLVAIVEVAHQYQMLESDPVTHFVRVLLKEIRKVNNNSCFVLSVETHDRQMTTILNQQQTIGLDESGISQINLEQDNNELQIQAINTMLEQTLFKKKKPIRSILSKLVGLMTAIIFIIIAIYNSYHFMDQINLMIQQYNSLLSLSKTNLRIADNSLLARRLNIHAFFQENNDTSKYRYYEGFYNVSILKMNSVYYETNSQILFLKGKGFDDSNADLAVTSWTYPNSKQQTQLYNILTMYIQSVTYLDTASMLNMTFQPLRVYNSSFTVYKSQMQDVIINTYASILPKFDIITPAVNNFWKNLIHRDDYVWYIILIFVVVYAVTLTVGVCLVDYYYVRKYEMTVNLMLDFTKNDINMYVSGVENYQYKMFPEYYETNWINALLYLFEDNDPTKKIKGANNETQTNHNLSQVSNILTPMEQDTKLRKRSKNKSSKQVNLEDQKKSPYNLKVKYRSVGHFIGYFVFIVVVIGYFISDFGLVRNYMNKLIVTTSQLSEILERMKLISSMRFATHDSLFELNPWPTKTSLAQQAKQYSNQLFANEQKLQAAEVTYPEWTNQIFRLNSVNICDSYELFGANNDYSPTKDDCYKTSGGILTKGFSLSLSTFSNLAQTFYMLSNSNMTNQKLKAIIFSDAFRQFNDLTEYLLSTSKYLRNLYLKVMVNKYSTYGDSFKLKGFLFSAILVFLLILWNYIVNQMSFMTEETRGLLKLITLSKIQKTEKIKKALMNQGIIQSLK